MSVQNVIAVHPAVVEIISQMDKCQPHVSTIGKVSRIHPLGTMNILYVPGFLAIHPIATTK